MFGKKSAKLAAPAIVASTGMLLTHKYAHAAPNAQQNSPEVNNSSLLNSFKRSFTPVANYLTEWNDWLDPAAGILGKITVNKSYFNGKIHDNHLDLHNLYLGHEYYKIVAGLLELMPEYLPEVDLSSNSLGVKQTFTLVHIFSKFKPNTKKIKLSGNGFGENPSNPLPQALGAINAPIEVLDLSYNQFDKLGAAGFAAVSRAIPKSVKSLSYYENGFVTMPINDLIAGIQALDAHIESLNLRYSGLGKRSGADACAVVACIKAKRLSLQDNHLGKLSADDFAKVVASLSDSIEELDLTTNGFEYTTEQWLKIIAAMKPSLKKVILHGNSLASNLKQDGMLKVLDAFSQKLEAIDISYNSVSGNADYYLQMFEIANRFKYAKLDYFSVFSWYSPSPQNDAKVLEMIRKLPKSQVSLGWFWLSGISLSTFRYELLLEIIKNAPAHITLLDMHASGSYMVFERAGYFREEGTSGTYVNPQYGDRARYSVEQWQQMLSSAPANITRVNFYGCGFGKIYANEQLAEIFSSLNDSVQEVGLGLNSICIRDAENAYMLKQGLKALKPGVKTVDLRLNYFYDVPVAELIAVLESFPTTVETVYLPEDIRKQPNWTQADYHLLSSTFPEICQVQGVGEYELLCNWQRPQALAHRAKLAL